jgi:hypothetical protein
MRLSIHRYDETPLGLKDKSFVFTNSERGLLACTRKWWFSEVEALRPRQASDRPLRYGAAWASTIEDVQRWWMRHDCAYPEDGEWVCAWCTGSGCTTCQQTGHGIVRRILADWNAIADRGLASSDDWEPEKDAEGIRRALYGWFRASGTRAVPEGYRVVGVECSFAAPVLDLNQKPYRSALYMVQDVDRQNRPYWRLARTGESRHANASKKSWPWVQIGKLDALWQDRSTNDLVIWEGKTSKSAEGYLQGLSVDPQVPGYAWLLSHHLKKYNARRVAGFIYDVTSSSFQADPTLLAAKPVPVLDADGNVMKSKGRNVYQTDAEGNVIERSPGFSKVGSVPSWRFEQALKNHPEFDPSDYREHLSRLLTDVDSKLYVREFATVGPEVVKRYAREVYGIAQRLSALRLAAQRVGSPEETDVYFPRNAYCRYGGSVKCGWKGVCVNDGELPRSDYDVEANVKWFEGEKVENKAQMSVLELGW